MFDTLFYCLSLIIEGCVHEEQIKNRIKEQLAMRYFIFLSYDGTAYHGWQVQPNAVSVQQRMNEALSKLLRGRNSVVTGAGRTDAGVHAHMMVAHFDVDEMIDCNWLVEKINRLLPCDIVVNKIVRVKPDAHARFDARSRTYHYWIYTHKNPFQRHYATRITFPLDFNKMNEAAAYLLNVRDFTSFSKLHTDVKTNICRVVDAKWVQVSDDMWRFEITADRFLRNMVRAVVGTLIEVGRGRLSVDDFKRVISCKNRCAAGDSMPGNALSLVDITYDDSLFQVEQGHIE